MCEAKHYLFIYFYELKYHNYKANKTMQNETEAYFYNANNLVWVKVQGMYSRWFIFTHVTNPVSSQPSLLNIFHYENISLINLNN